ncbi:MAG: 50S ribosomal protein L1, partial [Candidatus Omnitrophica bacterium]|nr:50S ribosomal protein L1 [Candidatus Omnitrophota bacterium]
RHQSRKKLVEAERLYSLEEAVKLVKQIKDNKFDETISLNFQLGIRPEQSEEMVRGTVNLPHGSGNTKRVICFAKGEGAREAQAEGADQVGAEELIQKVQGGWMEFDAVVAHPDMMREVSKLGKVLGPKGLMPSPKTGTVTPNVGRAVKELKAGRIEFKSDKTGGLHAICGKISFNEKALLENARVVIRAVVEAKPSASKGDYMKRVTMAPAQGPGFRLTANNLV